jgi:hypothetical protein
VLLQRRRNRTLPDLRVFHWAGLLIETEVLLASQCIVKGVRVTHVEAQSTTPTSRRGGQQHERILMPKCDGNRLITVKNLQNQKVTYTEPSRRPKTNNVQAKAYSVALGHITRSQASDSFDNFYNVADLRRNVNRWQEKQNKKNVKMKS